MSPRFLPEKEQPAAFRRLCVETSYEMSGIELTQPAAFRRLCVETLILSDFIRNFSQPPSGGCVLKQGNIHGHDDLLNQPPSGGCVLKQLPLILLV